MSKRQKELFPELPSTKKYVSDYPELASEWHPTKNGGLIPEDFTHGSPRKVWWRCSNDPKHVWKASINNRCKVVGGRGCPYCAGKIVSETYNLAVVNPNLCLEWHPKNKKSPSDYLPQSGKKVWWRCSMNPQHEWEAVIASRNSKDGAILIGCPYCAGQKASPEYNFSIKHNELLSEWDYSKNVLNPVDLTPNSHTKVWWVCSKGHQWYASPHNRRKGTGCPRCTHQTSKAEIRILTELMAVYDEVLSRYKIQSNEIDIYIPALKVGIEYDGAFWHRDKQEKDVAKQNKINSLGIRLMRVREKPLKKINNHDKIVNPKIDLSKDVVNAIVRWISCDHPAVKCYLEEPEFVNQELFNIYIDYFPSPFPEKSLQAENPHLTKEWHPTKNAPLTPLNFTPNSRHKIWWQCNKGHEWQATIDSRNSKRGGTGCPYCSPTFKLVSPENNMAVSNPNLLKYFHPTKNGGITPDQILAGTSRVIWWQCPNDPTHEFQRSPNHMSSSSAGELCPYCSGFLVSTANCMATTNPEMAEIFHPKLNGKVTPERVKSGSKEKFWWRCENGHEWEQTAFNIKRAKSETPCPICKTLAGMRPDVAALLHPTKNGALTGYDLSYWSTEKVWWQCNVNEDHVWQTSASTMVRADRKSLCHLCPPRRIHNCMAETHPMMAKAFHPHRNGQLSPINTAAGTGKNLWWVCSVDPSHQWQSTGVNMKRVKRPDLCPKCRKAL